MSSRPDRDSLYRQWLRNNVHCRFSQLDQSLEVSDFGELATVDLGFPVRSNRYLVAILRSEYPQLFGRVANRHNNIAYFQHLHFTTRAEMRLRQLRARNGAAPPTNLPAISPPPANAQPVNRNDSDAAAGIHETSNSDADAIFDSPARLPSPPMEYDDFWDSDVESNIGEDFIEFSAHSPPFAGAGVRAQDHGNFCENCPDGIRREGCFLTVPGQQHSIMRIPRVPEPDRIQEISGTTHQAQVQDTFRPRPDLLPQVPTVSNSAPIIRFITVDSDSDTDDELPPALNFLPHQDTPSPPPPQQPPFADLFAVAVPPLMPDQEAQQPSPPPIFWDPIDDLMLDHEDDGSSDSMSEPPASPLPDNDDPNDPDYEANVGPIAPRVQPPR